MLARKAASLWMRGIDFVFCRFFQAAYQGTKKTLNEAIANGAHGNDVKTQKIVIE